MRESRPYGSERGRSAMDVPTAIGTAMLLAMPSSNRSQRGLSFESRAELKSFAIPERQSDAVAEGIESSRLGRAGDFVSVACR